MAKGLTNTRLLDAIDHRSVDRPPVWIMRQAGRYLPEYRRLRKKAGDFLTLCKTPGLACDVTLQPVERYPLDAAIIFSDILTIPDAMGLGLDFEENRGPFFKRPIRDEKQVAALRLPDEEDLNYVMEAIHLVCQRLDGRIPLIGFTGSPWTMATYMVEGRGTHNFSLVKKMMLDRPDMFKDMLDLLATAGGFYLAAQVKAGCRCVMIFDSWGGVLTSEHYLEYSLAPMQKLMTVFNEQGGCDTPIILFTKGGGMWLEAMARTGCAALGLDWTINIGEAKRRVGQQVALQGNLDPCILLASAQTVKREVRKVLDSFGGGVGHIFNLGHGIYPSTDPENLHVLIETVHNYFRR
ncbi:MAG: uroporphyrinogen decarboxylase [Gammaproteobacteria bacterium]|nr:uroporphyrinogen decarboxylase [Gammaproteobacteria bacterium]